MSTLVAMTLSEIKQEHDHLLDPLDIPRTWTDRQVRVYEDWRAELRSRYYNGQTAERDVARFTPQLAQLVARQQELTGWRESLAKELVALPPARSTHDRGVRQNLTLSIRVVDSGTQYLHGSGYGLNTLRLGELMRASGYAPAPPHSGQFWGELPWVGSLDEVESSIRDVTRRLRLAERQLAACLAIDPSRRPVTSS